MPGTGITYSGFPSPAQDFTESRLDLNRLIIAHPLATFFMRVSGEAMQAAGIHAGDILVVDRALNAGHRDVVVAVVAGELMIRRLWCRDGRIRLLAENPDVAPLPIQGDTELIVWGVATYVLHDLRPHRMRNAPPG